MEKNGSLSIMDIEGLLELQHSLIETRKIFPPTIKAIYERARATYTKYLLNNSLDPVKLPEIPDEILECCQTFEKTGDNVLDVLAEQIRMMIILADKKECKYSKVIDAI